MPSGCTFTSVLSSDTTAPCPSITPASRNPLKTLARTPFLAHRRQRWYTVFHGPNLSGSARHLHPFSSTYSIPLSSVRLSCFTFPRCRGSRCLIFSNCDSVISMATSLS